VKVPQPNLLTRSFSVQATRRIWARKLFKNDAAQLIKVALLSRILVYAGARRRLRWLQTVLLDHGEMMPGFFMESPQALTCALAKSPPLWLETNSGDTHTLVTMLLDAKTNYAASFGMRKFGICNFPLFLTQSMR
jgi:hypothetical protein